MGGIVAPAKVNLYLEVLSRRPDGYHEVATLYQTLDWGDEVSVFRTPTPGVTCATAGAEVPSGDGNLAVRAAKAYLAASGRGGGVRIVLSKRIPLGAGLGGGSSDAGAVLRVLESKEAALGPSRLQEVAASLGSDVPFFLVGGGAIGVGRGEVVKSLAPAPEVTVVLVIPPFGTETARVYARCGERGRKAPTGGLERAVKARDSGDPVRIRDAHHNDLAEAAMRAYPEMKDFTVAVERLLGRPPLLSGSGSTLFDCVDGRDVPEVLARLAPLPGRREVVRTRG